LFKFRLALQLGRTVKELNKTVSAQELVYWMSFYKIDPFGGYRQDINFADLKTLIANINRAGSQEPYKTADFMLYERLPSLSNFSSDDEEMTAEDISQNLLAFFGVPPDVIGEI